MLHEGIRVQNIFHLRGLLRRVFKIRYREYLLRGEDRDFKNLAIFE